jgi:ABC-type antimicrobial peptide transport system permease subunit
MALGAARADVVQLVVRGSGTLAALGIVIGCSLAIVMGFALRGITYDGRGHDALTLAAVCALLAAVALLASWLPAQRATRVDPTLAMRL